MLDSTANNQIWLIVKSKEEIRHFYELALDEPEFPAETLSKLKDRKLLTHFKTSKESIAPANTWHFVETHSLDKKNEFYYAILKNDGHFQMQGPRIKAYQEFLKQ